MQMFQKRLFNFDINLKSLSVFSKLIKLLGV